MSQNHVHGKMILKLSIIPNVSVIRSPVLLTSVLILQNIKIFSKACIQGNMILYSMDRSVLVISYEPCEFIYPVLT